MLPEGVISTFNIPSSIIGARAKTVDLSLEDFEDGGIDISDPSEGLDYQEWKGEFVDQKITITGENGNTFDLVTITESESLTDFSFAFDQNNRPTLIYVVDEISYLLFYDTLIEDYNTVQQADSMYSPKLFLDDKRSLNISNSDIILAYINYDNKSLCYRQQRDRYLIEYVLVTEIDVSLDGVSRLVRLGMGRNLRLQFVLY